MSAHKKTTITLSEAEYRKLHEAAMRKRLLKKELPRISKELRRETEAALSDRFLEMDKRHQRFMLCIDELDGNMRETEWRSAQELHLQQEDLWNTLHDFAGNLWNQTTAELLEQREVFHDELQIRHEQSQKEILQLTAKFEDHAQEQERHFELAKSWLDSAVAYRNLIDASFDHQAFAPEAVTKLETLIVQAAQNLDQGMPEAALTQAQQACNGLSSLRLALEEGVTQWEVHYSALLEQSHVLLRLMEKNKHCQAIDLNGNTLEIDVDVDYWTEGKFSEQMNYLRDLIEQLETHSALLDTNRMKHLLDETIPNLHAQVEEYLAEARLNVIRSQIRVNIADFVLQSLREQGFAVQESGFQQGDMRYSFFASASNLDGSNVIVQVDPINGSQTQNELHLHSYEPEIRTHHELRQRTKEINQAIARRGLQVGATSTQPEANIDFMQRVEPRQSIKVNTR